MKIRISNIKGNIFALIVAFSFILYLNPYFLWDSFQNGRYAVLKTLFLSVSYLLTIIMFFIIKRKSLDRKKIIISFFFCVVYMYMLLTGNMNEVTSIGNYLFMIFMITFVFLEEDGKILVFKYSSWLFALFLIIPIIIWFLLLLGLDLPHDTIQPWETIKINRGAYYDHYFLCIFRRERWGRELTYLNGIFDEQGVIGTFCGLFLAADNMNLKKFKNIVLMVGGILSFSLAFFVIIIINYICQLLLKLDRKKLKRLAIVIGAIVFVIVILGIGGAMDNSLFYKEFLSRFTVSSLGDRSDAAFNAFFYDFITGSPLNMLFGSGKGAFSIINVDAIYDASTFLILIFDYGVIGFLLIVAWLISSGILLSGYNKRAIPFIVVFVFSMYQRPYVISFAFMILFIAGVSNLVERKIKQNA